MMNKALIIVDMEKGFFQPTDKLQAPKDLDRVARNIKLLVDECHRLEIPVIYCNDAFQPAEVPIDYHFKLWGVHALKGDPSADVIDLLKPDERDFIIDKKIYDGFYNTRLDTVLRELRTNTVFVTGTWTNACVQHTVMGAWARRYETIVPDDAVTAPDEDEHWAALSYMSKYYGTMIVNTHRALELVKE
ncbi:cysteine hydrolase family protein [Chloroflexota bacterium]